MKILFFFTFLDRIKDVFDVQTEIILHHLRNGDNLIIVVDLKGEGVFLAQSRRRFIRANKYQYNILFDKFLKLLEEFKGQYEIVNYEKSNILDNSINIPNFQDVDDIKNYVYNGFPIGVSVASSLIDYFRDHKFNPKLHKNKIKQEILISTLVLDTISKYTDRENPDKVYVHNGRLAHFAPVVIYCKNKKIPFTVFEFPFTDDKYHLIDNNIPHNIEIRNKEILDTWTNTTIPKGEKIKIAKNFFEGNRKGTPLVGIDFTTNQKKDLESINLPIDKEIITFFNSSIDEFASVPGWDNYIYLFEDEVSAIKSICQYFEKDKNKHFVLRIHPNLMYLDNTQTRNLKKLNGIKNLTIFQPESSVFSYQLVDISSKIITFGSTMGIEATFFEKPSICLGLSFYSHLDVCYLPKSKEELYNLIDNRELNTKPKENTYPYGFWAVHFGEEFVYKGKYFPDDYYMLNSIQRKKVSLIKMFSISFFRRLFSKRDLRRLMNSKQRKRLIRLFLYGK